MVAPVSLLLSLLLLLLRLLLLWFVVVAVVVVRVLPYITVAGAVIVDTLSSPLFVEAELLFMLFLSCCLPLPALLYHGDDDNRVYFPPPAIKHLPIPKGYIPFPAASTTMQVSLHPASVFMGSPLHQAQSALPVAVAVVIVVAVVAVLSM